MDMMLKLHMMWGAMLLLFVLSLFLRKQKITVMLLRLSYLLMLGTGIGMLFSMGFHYFYLIKGLLAIALIGIMEMLVGKAQRGERATPILLILFVVLIVVVPAMGYRYISF